MSAYTKLVVTVEVEVWPTDVPDVQHYVDTGEHRGNSWRYMEDAEYVLRPNSEYKPKLSITPSTKKHWAEAI